MQIKYFMKRDSNAENVELYVYEFQRLFYTYMYAIYTIQQYTYYT
jgi:hypothetical protein